MIDSGGGGRVNDSGGGGSGGVSDSGGHIRVDHGYPMIIMER